MKTIKSPLNTMLYALAAFAAVWLAPGANAVTNLVVNGDFENPHLAGYVSDGPGSAAIPGWTVDTMPSDGVQFGPAGSFGDSSGSQYVQLTGAAAYSVGGGVSQTIATTPGAIYTISIGVGARSGAPVVGNFQFGGTNFSITAPSTSTFNTLTWQVFATSNSTVIDITGYTNSASRQLLIDNVVVEGQAENYWGGFVDGNWDSVTTNWGYGASFTDTTNMGFTNVNFSDINDFGNEVANTNIIVQASGISIGTVNLLNNLASYTFSNASGNTGITGATAINKTGAGLDTFAGAETYTGATTISAGTLALGAGGSISSSPIINIASNATFNVSAAAGFSLGSNQTLTGNGSVTGNVDASAGGKISAGAAGVVGKITFNNNLTLGGQKLTFDISSITNGDLVNVVGNLINNGTVTIALNPLANLGAGTYTLITYAALAGSGTFVLDSSTPRNVSLNVGGTALSITVAGSVGTLTWQGDGTANSWDTEGTKNWLNNGTNDFFYQGDSVVFDDTGSSSPAINLTTALQPGNVTVTNNAKNYTFGGSGKIGGIGTLAKQGSGTLILDNTGSNNFSGGITIDAGGILQVGNNDANGNLPASGKVTNNGTLVFDGTNIAGAISGTISGSGTINQNGSGTTILSGNNSYSGGTTITNGTLQLNGQSSGGTGAIFVSPGATLALSEGGGNTFPNSISFDGATINTIGTGNGPYLQIGSPLIGNGTMNVGYSGVGRFVNRAASGGIVAGQTVNITNNGQVFFQSGGMEGTINVSGGGDGDGYGALRIETTIDGGVINLTGNTAFRNNGHTVAAVIQDGGHGYGFTNVTGSGTLTLTATNTYSGTTTIVGGTVALGATGSISNSAAINLAGGTFDVSQVVGGFSLNTSPSQTLTGSGTVNGGVTAGASQIIPGGIGAGGQLTFNSGLVLNGQTLAFDLGANSSSPSNDLVTVQNSPLTLNSATMISLNYLAGSLAPGIYTLLTYPSITGAGTFTLASAYPGVALNVGSTATTLSVGTPSATLTWQGDGTANNWDLTSMNWLNGATPSVFAQSNNVVFNDAGSAVPAVNLTGNLQPGLISVTGSKNYTFSGPGSLTGAAFLAQVGSGTLIINNSNNYTGGTVIASGTLQLGTNGSSGSIAGPITDNSQLALDHNSINTNANVISGTGSLTVNGSGLEVLTAGNSYSAGTTINAGTLQLNGATAAGSGSVNINNNAALNLLAGGFTFANGITGSGVINIVPITGAAGNYAQFNGSLNVSATINVPAGPGVARVITTSRNGSGGTFIFNVTNGGELYVQSVPSPANNIAATVNVAGTGVGDGFGAIRIDAGALSGNITLTGNATVGSSGTGTIGGGASITPISDNTNGYSLTVVSHTINFNGVAGMYYGNTIINGGDALVLQNGSAIENSAAVNIASNGTFNVSGDGGVGNSTTPYPIPASYLLGSGSPTQELAGVSENGIINGYISLYSGGSLGVTISNDRKPSLIVNNGALTLNDNPVIVTASALPLEGGTYTLVTNSATGTVAGDVSTSPLTFAGAGLASNATASLLLSNSVLYLVVVQPPLQLPPTFNSVVSLPGNGGSQLIFSGTAGYNYSLLATTNLTIPLTNWQVIATGSFGTNMVTNIDLGATNYPQRFYDIRSQ